jgi:hypothetical protein
MVLLGKAFGLPGLAAAGVLRFSLDFALLLYANQSGRFAFASAHRLGPLRLGQLLALTAAVLAAPILVVELASAASRAPLVALLLLPLLALGWHAAQHLRQRR